MSNDDIYVTERYFGGKIILKGYRDPITHKPTKEFNALHNAFTLIANSEAGAELAERIATSPEGTGPRTIWATPQTAADAGVLPGGKAPAGSRAIPDKDSFKDIRTGTHLLQRFDGTLNVVADLDPVNNSASMPPKLRYNIYYGVDGAYHREAPDMILFHELVHAILGTIDPAEDADSIPGATVRATNKYALEKGYVPQAVYGRPPVDPKGEIFAPDQWISGGTKDSYLKSPDARANVFPDTSGTILHKKDFRHRQLQDQQYPYANASSVDLLRMLIRH
jgi:hypothetical protein